MFRNYVHYLLFSILSVVTGVCPRSSGLLLGLVTPVRVLLFLRVPLPNFSFISFYPLLVCSPPPALLGFSGFASFLWFAFLQFRLWLHFLGPLVLAFLHAAVRTAPCVLSQSSFPRAMATVACFHSSSTFTPPAAVLAVPSCFSPPFSVWCVSFCSLDFFLGFPLPVPPAALRFCRSTGCLPCCGFSFGCTSVVRVLFTLHFCWVFFAWVFSTCFVFLPCPSGCVLSLGVYSS